MSIKTIDYDSAFQITLDWVAGLRRMVIYSRPADLGPLDDAAILQAMDEKRLKALCSGYEYGPETKHFSYAPDGMSAQWIDIYCCDIGMGDEVIRHTCAGRFFNGSCRVTYEVKRISIADQMEAIRLRVRNRSEFALKAGGIGYSVSGRLHPIPIALQRNEERELPQFEVPSGAAISIRPVPGGYPVKATQRESGKD